MKPYFLVMLSLYFNLPEVICGQEVPQTGPKVAGYEKVNEEILNNMKLLNASAATVALSREGKLYFSRGYGWSDADKKIPTQPDTFMRIASVSKPITAATVKHAIEQKKFQLSDKAFSLLDITPPGGKITDERIHDITIEHLLTHKGGWDRSTAFDPMFRMPTIQKELMLSGAVTPRNVVEYMLTQKLQFAPGEKTAYSNFGYCVLGRVLEQQFKKPYIACVQELVLKPHKIDGIRLGQGSSSKRDPKEVWYPVSDTLFSLDVMDAHGGLIASAPALCQFLDKYWISGDIRKPGQKAGYTFFGSLPGTTAMVLQRTDGWNVAVLLNGRRNSNIEKDTLNLRKTVSQAIDAIPIP
ncbi:MAG: serine hydrolase domain-containing protein [Zavarzinella sp.]